MRLLLALLLLLPLAARAAGIDDEDDQAPTFNDVLLFAEVYDYAVGGPDTSLGLTCASSSGDAGTLDDTERAKLTAMYDGPAEGWAGFLPASECTAIRAEATEDGPSFTELVNTGTPEAFAGREGVSLFVITRFCGLGCGSVDHMTVIEEPTGYRPIWGVPRVDGSGDIVFDNVQGEP